MQIKLAQICFAEAQLIKEKRKEEKWKNCFFVYGRVCQHSNLLKVLRNLNDFSVLYDLKVPIHLIYFQSLKSLNKNLLIREMMSTQR